jgi:hypothetical protein
MGNANAKKINKMETFTLLTKEDIQQMVDDSIAKAMRLNVPKPIRKTNLSISEAIIYLAEIGYKCSSSQLYKSSMTGDIPLEKFGRKLLFNADTLSKWVESKKTKSIDISMCVAQSASLKMDRKNSQKKIVQTASTDKQNSQKNQSEILSTAKYFRDENV